MGRVHTPPSRSEHAWSPQRLDQMRRSLDELYARYDRGVAVSDPIQLVRPYSDPADREIAGFLAAGLAFGRVESIKNSVGRVLGGMGPSPSQFVRAFDPRRDVARLAGCGHRWTTASDIAALVLILRDMLRAAGSIEQFFLDGDQPGSDDVKPGLESLCQRAREVDLSPVYGGPREAPGAYRFFPLPSAGSACKRLNLFLRWMVRRDGIDLGVWRRVSPSRLIVPLDVHIARVSRRLGLTARASEDWKTAAGITSRLRLLDPDDPVRFDFALCHVEMEHPGAFNP